MTQTPNVSVIIPNLHSPHLGDLLTALAQQTRPPDQVIVVGQDRYGFVAQHPPSAWLQWISTPRPVSPALARNIGIAHARGDVLCFIDADCIPTPDWLERLCSHATQHPVAGGSIIIGGETLWQRCDNMAIMGAFLETATAGQRPFLISANLLVWRQVLAHIGLFDACLISAEDADLSFRLRQHGYLLWFAPDARVEHRTGRTTPHAVYQHSYTYGTQWITARHKHTAFIGRARWHQLLQAIPWLTPLLVGLLALRDLYHIYRIQPLLLARFPTMVPLLWWARTAWYYGQIATLRREWVSA